MERSAVIRRSATLASLVAGAALLLAAALACQSSPAEPRAHNRDRHGPPDVERYIEMLEREDRIRLLRPDRVIEALRLPPDAIVADIGSGPGVFALRLARACPRGVIYAVDVEPLQLDALRARMAEQRVGNVVPVLASYDDPHLPPGRIDLMLIADTYHHLSNRVEYLRRLRRYLAPGGRLAILEYKPGELPVGPPAHHKLPEGQRQRELHAAGWERALRLDAHTYHEFEIWHPAAEP
jgi:SAM-dependent methyltransferase